MTHKTTRAHYEKWAAFVRERGLTLHNLQYFGLRDKDDLAVRHEQDPNLNNISLAIFDNLWASYQVAERPKTWALYEGACAYKHLLIYHVLEYEPEFTD